MKPEPIFPESAKQRSLRIPLDYVRRWDPIQQWKLLLTFLGALGTGAYIAWSILASKGPVAFSPGSVSHVHAAWDHSCEACHVDFVHLQSGAENLLANSGVIRPPDGTLGHLPLHHRANQKCQNCHAGLPHHERVVSEEVGTCASCHPDHRGRNAEIARPADANCTRCHQEIQAHRRGGAPAESSAVVANVLQFHHSPELGDRKPHPEFRSLASDPGSVKFHHSLHLTAGIPAPDRQGQGEGKRLLTLADLPPEFVERYRRPDQPRGARDDRSYPVQLDCDSCHRLDVAGDRSATTVQTRLPTAGRYMLPVRFDDHCQACHPLQYEPVAGKVIRHGLTPEEAREFLFGRYMYEAKGAKLNEAATPLIPRRRIPGRSPAEELQPQREIDMQVAMAEQYLRTTQACRKCHVLKASATSPGGLGLPSVEPANIPAVWLRMARFDHTAHRNVKCAECHALAYARPTPAGPPGEQSDADVVMIGGRDVCLKCHSPQSATRTSIAARFDCVECHQYHHTGRSARVSN